MRLPPWAQGAFVTTATTLGGLAIRDPAWALAGWASVALLAWAMTRWRATAWSLGGLVLGGSLGAWLALPWLPAAYDAAGGPGWAWVAAVPTTTAWAFMARAPIGLAWWALGPRLPAWLWLPPSWLLGELWLESAASLQIDAWLYGQWQVEPVLRALATLGWEATTLACLLLASALGAAAEGLRRPPALSAVRWPLAIAALLLLAGLALPARPARDADALARVGAVHMPTIAEPPRRAPDGIDLLVWPEEVASRHPRLPEGPAPARRFLKPPALREGLRHLIGAHTRVPNGRYMNAIVAVEPDGRVVAMRGKRMLFPLVERSFLGLIGPGREPMEPGRAPATFALGPYRVGSVVCVEGFNRHLMHEVRAAGAQLIAISANDQLLGFHPVGDRQMLSVAVLRAIESGLPVVRSTMYGRACLVAPDGRVLAWSPPGTSGVLKLGGAGAEAEHRL